MSDVLSSLLGRIQNKTASVGIIGLGYVGLPLARAFARGGFRVLGFDIDPVKVAKLNSGKSYIEQIPDSAIAEMRSGGIRGHRSLRAGSNEPDAILICVPTPLTESREPDLTYVVDSAQRHRVATRAGPTRRPRKHDLSHDHPQGRASDPGDAPASFPASDFFLAFSPEREDPGNATFSVHNIPKVVGGLDDAEWRMPRVRFIPRSCRRWCASRAPEVAEACKILENTYRAVNIALVNELKVLYDRMGIDVWEVIDAAKTKPFGFQAFYPGPVSAGTASPSTRSISPGSPGSTA